MPISSDTLFHFTNRLENLISILENTFRPHYSIENLNVLSPEDEVYPKLEFAIPMVCFCDIPLSNTKDHLATYGNYGIGLTKEWGMQKGITPVLYTYPNSGIVKKLRDLVDDFEYEDKNSEPGAILLDRFYEISRYIKPYEGKLHKSDNPENTIRFYDEREWRYVSDFVPNDHYYGLSKEDYLDDDINKEISNLMFEGDRIHFEPSNIKYLIVSEEVEKLPLIRRLEEIKSRFSQDEIKLLTTRIVSVQDIASDF